MLIADDVVVNPAECPVVPPRTEQSLSELGLSVVGADWGDSASGQSGSESKTRTIVLDLICREDADVDLPTAAYRLQQIVGQMQEEAETWIKRVPKVGGDWAGAGMYRIRRSPTAEEPVVTLSGFGGWAAGDTPQVTLTMVADFPFLSTEEVEGETHSTTTARQLVYTEPASGGSTRGLSRTRITNDNSSGDWRGLIFARECRDYGSAATAEPWYECSKLTPKGVAEVKEAGGTKAVNTGTLTEGWQTVLSTVIVGTGHMTHRGGRRVWLRALDQGIVANNVQFRLVWRALGSSTWVDDNPIATIPVITEWCLLDLGSVLPQVAALGNERWEAKVLARALNGAAGSRLRDFYPLPTEQYMVMSESEVAPIDGEPITAASTLEDNSAVGTVAWTSPTKAGEDPPGGATLTLAGGKTSHYLKATNWGFTSLVPEGAIIKGVGFSFVPLADANVIFDNQARIIVGGVVKEAGDQAKATAWPSWEGIERTYGGPGNTFGQPLTRANVVASTFGFAISVTSPSGGIARLARLRATIHYTEGQNEPVICTATRSLEVRSHGVFRQAPAEDDWGHVVPNGFLPFATPGALEGRTQRTIIIPTQGDFGERADAGTPNKVTAQGFERAGDHVARGAA